MFEALVTDVGQAQECRHRLIASLFKERLRGKHTPAPWRVPPFDTEGDKPLLFGSAEQIK